MPKPIILAVDDDRSVLAAVERDLRRRYGKDYRIVSADSGTVALSVMQRFNCATTPSPCSWSISGCRNKPAWSSSPKRSARIPT